jgi:class 3 adenylate cyclase
LNFSQASQSAVQLENEPTITFLERQMPVRREFVVLHGSIRSFNALVERVNPEDLAASLNDFFMTVAARIQSRGGRFERYGGSSFIGFWTQPVPAMRTALDLRKDLARLNEAFRLDGQKLLSFSMGLSSGVALAGKIGSPEDRRYSIAGEVISCARALDRLCPVVGQDLLVSGEVWKQPSVSAQFFGDSLGEVKLTNDTGLVEYRSIEGFIDEQGVSQRVESASAHATSSAEASEGTRVRLLVPRKSERWMVNNGSQIQGPMGVEQVASRLFAQELDFDCECWRDGGAPARIEQSLMFGSAPEEGAHFWVYDGQTVHGPLTAKFLQTAILRGALAESAFVCEKSTIQGWMPLSQWMKQQGEPAEATSPSPVKAKDPSNPSGSQAA